LIKIQTDPLNNYYLFHHNTPKAVIRHKFQQFTNKYNFTKSKTNHNKYKVINSYYNDGCLLFGGGGVCLDARMGEEEGEIGEGRVDGQVIY
jgi:hypothetical protein